MFYQKAPVHPVVSVEFPEVLHLHFEDAKNHITQSHPHLDISPVLEGTFVIQNYVHTRLRVYVNENNMVVSIPRTG